ncbi:MAG: tRNA dihydrouridine synthase DusB [Rickettsia sp.]|nr:tRNA dihydrouridine synthase DusB [Rickettsia sp.]
MKKIKIGSLELSNNIILAPMSGITDFPYRQLVKKCGGVGLVVSEMIASRAMINNALDAIRRSKIDSHDKFSSIQLAGCEAEVIALAAKMNEDMGASIIDLNFGCPAKKVVNGYSGSALMKDEKLAQKIFELTVRSVKIPVTVKMRLGWDENNKNALKLSKIAENSGIQMITIHARTRSQFFSGNVDWSFVSDIKKSVKIPVIINGDIKSFVTAKQALELSCADGIMVGRGCYGKPWLFKQLSDFLNHGIENSPPNKEKQMQIILEHYDHMIEYYGVESGLKIARKHLGWYSNGIKNSSHFRAKINQSNSSEDVKYYVQDLFAG